MFFSNMKSDSDSSHINPSIPKYYFMGSSNSNQYSGNFPISFNSIGGTAGAQHFYKKVYE